jgi:GNAT superfamily N-acetyltransferase
MLVTEELIAQIERSEATRLRETAEASGGDIVQIAGGVAAFCGDGSPMTQVCAVGIGCEVSVEELDTINDLFVGRATQYEFKLSVLADLSLRERVVHRACSLPEFETILVVDLSKHELQPVAFEFRQVEAEGAREYAQRSVTRFFSGAPGPPGLADVIACSCTRGDSVSYEVYMDGQPVAGCGLGLCEGIAWLQGAATEPEYRNRGLHKAMQQFRMGIAKERGYKVMAQGALPGSLSQLNAQKSGMQVAFTRPTFYIAP